MPGHLSSRQGRVPERKQCHRGWGDCRYPTVLHREEDRVAFHMRPTGRGEAAVLIFHLQMCCCFTLHSISTRHLLKCKPYDVYLTFAQKWERKKSSLPTSPSLRSFLLLFVSSFSNNGGRHGILKSVFRFEASVRYVAVSYARKHHEMPLNCDWLGYLVWDGVCSTMAHQPWSSQLLTTFFVSVFSLIHLTNHLVNHSVGHSLFAQY